MARGIDLTGQRFGRLTVIKQGEPHIYPSGSPRRTWICKCDCGNEVTVKTNLLRNGHTTSCGCLHSEYVTKFNKETKKKFNTYDLSGEFGIGYDCNGVEFYFDKEDYDKIKDYCWSIRKAPMNNTSYVETNITYSKYNYGRLKMHRLIMNCDDKNCEVDHINLNGLDNRKQNLRITDDFGNNKNKDLRKDNLSGVTGVSFDSNKKMWCAYIRSNNKRIHIGYYNDFNEAVKARLNAEVKYFGEYTFQYNSNLLDYLNDGGKLIPYDKGMINDIKFNYCKVEENNNGKIREKESCKFKSA